MRIKATLLFLALFATPMALQIRHCPAADETGVSQPASAPSPYPLPLGGELAVEPSRERGNAASAPAAAQASSAAVPSPYSYKLDFSTYLGGRGHDFARGIALDGQGNIYVTGAHASENFPTTPGTLTAGVPGKLTFFTAKFSLTGGLIWSTTGAGGYSIFVDSAGFVYGDDTFGATPTPGVFQPVLLHPGTAPGVGKLKPDGSARVWGSHFGMGWGRDMAMDEEGNIYLTISAQFGCTGTMPAGWFANAYQAKPHIPNAPRYAAGAAGLLKITNDGAKVLMATWVDGSKSACSKCSVAVGPDHCPFLLTSTTSDDMPTTPGAFSRTKFPGENDYCMWLGKFSADGSSLIFGTYFPGISVATHCLAIDPQGNIFMAVCSPTWPATVGAFQTKFGGGTLDYGIAKFSPTGALLAATYLGGSGNEINGPDQIVVDRGGNVMIVGASSSTDYPVTSGAFQSHNAGAGSKYPFSGVISILSNDLSTMLYSTYMGGSGGDQMARACAVGADGSLCVAGTTTSSDFPTKNAYQSAYGGPAAPPGDGVNPSAWGNGDATVCKLSPTAPPPVITAAPTATPNPAPAGQSVAFSVTAADPNGYPLKYRWDFGDYNSGSIGSGAAATHAYAAAGTYKVFVTVSDGRGGLATASLPVTVNAVPGSPTITTQPSRQWVTAGKSASLSVQAAGNAPLSYQWRKYGQDIPGATGATYAFPSAQVADSGTYTVVVANAAGSVTSDYTDFQVYIPPAITTQPANQSVQMGKPAAFSVAATGTRLDYQWLKNGKPICDQTLAECITPATGLADKGSTYTVIVSNPAGTITSDPATLTVNVAAPSSEK